MSSFWESSRSSLFVKTIWRDGHRHVVLDKETEPCLTRRKSSVKSLLTSRIASIHAINDKNHQKSLKMPSVKLRPKRYKNLLINLRKKRSKSAINPKTNRVPEESKSKSAREYFEKKIDQESKPISIKSCNSKSEMYLNCAVGTKIVKSNDHYTSLSERVLMWLDFTQKGFFSRAPKWGEHLEVKPKITVPVPRKTTLKMTKLRSSDSSFELAPEKFEEMSDEDEELKKSGPVLQCTTINLIDNNQSKILELKEEDEICLRSEQSAKLPLGVSKRQLHIFMPCSLEKFDETEH